MNGRAMYFLFLFTTLPAGVGSIQCHSRGTVVFAPSGSQIRTETAYPNQNCESHKNCVNVKLLVGGYGEVQFCPNGQPFGQTPPWNLYGDPCSGNTDFCEHRIYGTIQYRLCCCSNEDFCFRQPNSTSSVSTAQYQGRFIHYVIT